MKRGVLLGVVLGVALASAVARRLRSGGLPAVNPARLKSDLERDAIRWSGSFLASMGAVESAPRAQQEALLAHRVGAALADQLGDGVRDLSVLVIGGVIHLEGIATGPRERARAQQIAKEVSGAQVVAGDLQVEA